MTAVTSGAERQLSWGGGRAHNALGLGKVRLKKEGRLSKQAAFVGMR